MIFQIHTVTQRTGNAVTTFTVHREYAMQRTGNAIAVIQCGVRVTQLYDSPDALPVTQRLVNAVTQLIVHCQHAMRRSGNAVARIQCGVRVMRLYVAHVPSGTA